MPDTRCVVITVHGVGAQPETWSQRFVGLLQGALGPLVSQVEIVDAYWAPLSTPEELAHPTFAPGQLGAVAGGVEDETYRRTVLEFSRMMAADAGVPVGAPTLGPSDLFNAIKNRLDTGLELVADVGNYVARNGVRTGVQSVLHGRLGEAHRAHPGVPIVVVSHSQGTIITYDTLRQAGDNYPAVRAWVTMGSPLGKYLAFPLEWGRQQLALPTQLRWVNFYDVHDIVGKALQGLVPWPSPKPEDREVDNVGRAGGAHDHWHNPQVVDGIAEEIRRVVN